VSQRVLILWFAKHVVVSFRLTIIGLRRAVKKGGILQAISRRYWEGGGETLHRGAMMAGRQDLGKKSGTGEESRFPTLHE
jgi:hypothetical protein